MAEQNSKHKTMRGKKGLQSTKKIFSYIKDYLQEMLKAKRDGSKLIAWIGGPQTIPVEILHAMDILPQQIDSMAAVFAAKQLSERFIQITESKGYHHDLCTYYKTVYGYVLGGQDIPEVEGINWPEPDILLGSRSVCVLHPLGIRMLQRHFNVPTFIADDPLIHPRMDVHNEKDRWYKEHSTVGVGYKHPIKEYYLEYVKVQIRRLIAFLEDVSGKKLDWGRLRETVALSSKAAELFLEIQDLRRNVPCPVGAQDIMPLIGPGFYWAGLEMEVEIYQRARDEVREKVEKGEGAIPNERFRLFFEGIPPWYNLGLFTYLADRDAVSVAETYPFEFVHVMDPDRDPIDNLADKALRYMYNTSVQERSDLTLNQVEPYHLDGVIVWNSICCKIFTLFSPFMRYDLEKEFGIPTLILDADQADPREYNDAMVKNRIDAYLEMLDKRKQQKAV
ncbi:MAG TPA: 2-hydroxyacyl-CoA dehydratase [Candidatus Latescibacteria bacterium]|nr:2-hydroxyacyl-CoA dehydratase [Candidatus Latescibacterota bacterium]